jgi:hypothetical protein
LPPLDDLIDYVAYRGTGVTTVYPLGEKLIVSRVPMADVGPDRQFDGIWIEPACGSRTAHPARVLSARVVGNCAALRSRAAGKRVAQSLGKLAHVALVEFLPTLRCSLTGALAGRGIRQALSLRPLERRFFDQHSLTLVPLSRSAEPDDHRTEGRVLARSTRQRRITAGEEDEMVEVGASEAEGPFPFHPEKAPLPQFTPALRTCRITNDPEDDNVAGIATAGTAARWT